MLATFVQLPRSWNWLMKRVLPCNWQNSSKTSTLLRPSWPLTTKGDPECRHNLLLGCQSYSSLLYMGVKQRKVKEKEFELERQRFSSVCSWLKNYSDWELSKWNWRFPQQSFGFCYKAPVVQTSKIVTTLACDPGKHGVYVLIDWWVLFWKDI